MHRLRLRLACTLFATAATNACAPESGPDTQLIVAVSADAPVAARSLRIEARLFEPAPGASEPKRIQHFVMRPTSALRDAARVTLPFSFTVAQHGAAHFRIELRAFESESGGPPLIEQKRLVRLEAGRTGAISMHLESGCVEQALRCAAPDVTCSATQQGACVPVPEATVGPTLPGRETFVDGLPARLDASTPGMASAGTDAGAGPSDAPAEPAVPVVDLPPEPLASCTPESAQACPLPEYPCVPSDDGTSYVCRGQYATWPMPDSSPEAKFAPSYTVRAEEGVVRDDVTGLLWQRDLPASYPGCSGRKARAVGDTCTFEEAKRYCSNLTLAGKRWRLPSKVELESLLDYATEPGSASIDSAAFPAVPSDATFWTSTRQLIQPLCPNADCAYQLTFAGGQQNIVSMRVANLVRCVRSEARPSAPPAERFELDASGRQVRDAYTRLTWQRDTGPDTPTLDEARAYCQRYGVDWRVPTIKELFTLANVSGTTHLEEPAFVRTQGAFLWSSTKALLGGALVYSAQLGAELANDQSQTLGWPHLVRCVR